jgi:hypothetical protein
MLLADTALALNAKFLADAAGNCLLPWLDGSALGLHLLGGKLSGCPINNENGMAKFRSVCVKLIGANYAQATTYRSLSGVHRYDASRCSATVSRSPVLVHRWAMIQLPHLSAFAGAGINFGLAMSEE